MLLTAQLAVGFPTAVDGRVDKIVDNLAVVKPTFMGAAPRIFEKAHARVVTMTQAEGGVKKKIFDRAFVVGLEVDALRLAGKKVPPLLGRTAQGLRPARVRQDPGPVRRPRAVLHLRRGRPQP